MNVKITFFNENLEEEMYIEQPEEFVTLRHENKLCMLVKSVQGLKQALKQWHEKINGIIISNDFNICDPEKCVY